ncbi:hypothetical protein B7494_g3107 [Chlorociboria aeruginascens]|nr:hypothetical protein B7494_g3107 [Chlorociboria aeruginascens]
MPQSMHTSVELKSPAKSKPLGKYSTPSHFPLYTSPPTSPSPPFGISTITTSSIITRNILANNIPDRQIKLTPRQEKIAAQEAAPKPNKLAFRSLRNGNLGKGPATNYHETVLNTFMTENPILANGGLNPVKPPVKPVEEKRPVTSFVRLRSNEEDVIVTASKVYHNITRATKNVDAAGKEYTTYADTELSTELNYFIQALKSKSDNEVPKFWRKNWVGIVVDFRDEYESQLGLLHTIDSLGSAFKRHATKVSIAIYLPWIPVTTKVQDIRRSENYRILEILVTEINELQSIRNLEVVLHVPEREIILPHQNLIHFLPFYDFWFVNWKMKWMTPKFRSPRTLNSGKAFEYTEQQFAKVQKSRKEKGNED